MAHKDPEERRAYQKAHYSKNRRRYLHQTRKRHFLRKYDLTPRDFERLLAGQSGFCPVCSIFLVRGTGYGAAHVDHDHDTGRVRAVLCRECNLAIGNVGESPEILEALAAYLRQHS